MRSARVVVLLATLVSCSSAPEVAPAIELGADAESDWRRGRLGAAEVGYERALREDRLGADVPSMIRHLNNLGVVAYHRHGVDAARAHWERALDLCVLEPAAGLRERLLCQLACCDLRTDQLEAADSRLRETEEWARAAGGEDLVQWLLLRASWEQRSGRAEDARDLADRVLALAACRDAERATAEILLARTSDRTEDASRHYEAALRASRRAGAPALSIESMLGLSESLSATDPVRAAQYLQLAIEAADVSGLPVTGAAGPRAAGGRESGAR